MERPSGLPTIVPLWKKCTVALSMLTLIVIVEPSFSGALPLSVFRAQFHIEPSET
jgi:hypothetical protein